jgi:hypothetical protein
MNIYTELNLEVALDFDIEEPDPKLGFSGDALLIQVRLGEVDITDQLSESVLNKLEEEFSDQALEEGLGYMADMEEARGDWLYEQARDRDLEAKYEGS